MIRILLVDDNRQLLQRYRESLSHEGYEVVAAETVNNARVLLANENVDVVMMKLHLSGGEGFAFLNEVAARRLPVIVNTAYESLRLDFRTWCAEALVLKSSDCTALKAALRNICSKYNAARAHEKHEHRFAGI